MKKILLFFLHLFVLMLIFSWQFHYIYQRMLFLILHKMLFICCVFTVCGIFWNSTSFLAQIKTVRRRTTDSTRNWIKRWATNVESKKRANIYHELWLFFNSDFCNMTIPSAIFRSFWSREDPFYFLHHILCIILFASLRLFIIFCRKRMEF